MKNELIISQKRNEASLLSEMEMLQVYGGNDDKDQTLQFENYQCNVNCPGGCNSGIK